MLDAGREITRSPALNLPLQFVQSDACRSMVIRYIFHTCRFFVLKYEKIKWHSHILFLISIWKTLGVVNFGTIWYVWYRSGYLYIFWNTTTWSLVSSYIPKRNGFFFINMFFFLINGSELVKGIGVEFWYTYI